MLCTESETPLGEGVFCCSSGCVRMCCKEQPQKANDERELIWYYLKKGYQYKTIVLFLRQS